MRRLPGGTADVVACSPLRILRIKLARPTFLGDISARCSTLTATCLPSYTVRYTMASLPVPNSPFVKSISICPSHSVSGILSRRCKSLSESLTESMLEELQLPQDKPTAETTGVCLTYRRPSVYPASYLTLAWD